MRGGKSRCTGLSGEELANQGQGQKNMGSSMWYKKLGAKKKKKKPASNTKKGLGKILQTEKNTD